MTRMQRDTRPTTAARPETVAPRRSPAVEPPESAPWNWHEDEARIRRETYEAGLAEREDSLALPHRGDQDRQALAAARRVTISYPCQYCGALGTTAGGALWRVSLADDCAELYFLHSHCLTPYKQAHSLRSGEGRVPLPLTGAAALPGASDERRQPSPEVIADVELATVARPDDYRRLDDDEPLPDGYHGPRATVRVRDPRG